MIGCVAKTIKNIYAAIYAAIEHDGIEHAGYISFLLMLSLFPFLIFIIAATSFVGEKEIADIMIKLILESSWASFIDALKPRIEEITAAPPHGLLTIAIVSSIWTASSIFEGLRTILNKSFRVTSPPPYILRRLVSFAEFLITTIIVLALTIILIVLPDYLSIFIKIFEIKNEFLIACADPDHGYMRDIVLYSFTLLMIAYAYYTLPNCKHSFRSTLPGAILVLFLWACFGKIFGYYINYYPQVNFLYGSIAGIIIALLYFYFSSLIFIIGAEFNYLSSKNSKKIS